MLYLLLGLITRIIYGVWHEPWLNAPDQLAWDILLNEAILSGSLRYDQLIHYPHEGGTILISFMALIIKKSGLTNALTIGALIIDLASRSVQVFIVSKISNRTVFHAFAIWTVFSLPSILPWSTVNFGMHSLFSFVPFLVILLAESRERTSKQIAITGILAGLAIWLSYVNIVIIPIMALALFLRNAKWQDYGLLYATCTGVLLIHIWVRSTFDPGFHLAEFSGTEVRGLDYSHLRDLETYKRLYLVFIEALPGSSMLPEMFGFDASTMRSIWNWFICVGVGATLITFLRNRNQSILLALAISLIFVLLYAVSPFYDGHIDRDNYVYSRHLTYILPLLVFLTIYGLNKLRLNVIWLSLFIGLASIGSMRFMLQNSEANPKYREAGWVLGTKLGHDPERLGKIADQQPERSEALMEGMGWSITASILGTNLTEEERLAKFEKIRSGIRDEHLESFNNGVQIAFEKGMQPKLEVKLRPLILNQEVAK
ncbi:hypothetical protein OAA53_03085 [Salibacteraceae bacterium]|nr:hypothetical protein [Salibacteraceae bacterium]